MGRVLAVIAAVGVGASAAGCACLHRVIANNGYVPLGDLDLIDIAPKVDPARPERVVATPEDSFVGTVIPWEGYRECKDGSRVRCLRVVNNPIRPSYRFGVTLRRGPQEILATASAGLDLSLLKIGSLASIGITGSALHQIKLNNVWHGQIDLTPAQAIPFFLAAEPVPGAREPRYLWVTEFVAADVDNLSELGLSVGAKWTGRSPTDVTLKGGDKATLKGPGLLLGIRGFVGTARLRGTVPETALPEAGQTARVSIALGDPAATLTLLLSRTGPGSVQFQIVELTDALVFVRPPGGSWSEREVVECTTSCSIPPSATVNGGITRVVVVKRSITSEFSLVVSLGVYRDGDRSLLAGQAYHVTLSTVP